MLIIRSLFVPALLALAVAGPAAAQTVAGPARVLDGDTLEIAGTRVRLFALDAPEPGQDCADRAGRNWDCAGWATQQVRARVDGRRVTCEGRDIDRWGRLVAVCSVDGRDLGAALVEDGVAVALPEFGQDYVDAEKRASIAGRGLWAGRFERPSAHRAAGRAVASAPQAAPVGCAIKGNISGSGRIYHLPGQADYDATRIDPSRGERWFCSEAEARDAGWRPARR